MSNPESVTGICPDLGFRCTAWSCCACVGWTPCHTFSFAHTYRSAGRDDPDPRSKAVDEVERSELLRQMIEAHGRVLRAAVARAEFDRATVEDVVQDVFELAFRRIDDLATRSAAEQRRWLLGAARNIGSNIGRRDGARRRVLGRITRQPQPIALSPEEALFELHEVKEESERAALLRSLVDRLPPRHRRVLVLHVLGYTGPQIARKLRVTPDAARAQVTRSRRALRELYEGRIDGDPDEGGAS